MSRFTALCLLCGLMAVSCTSAAPRSEDIIYEVFDDIKEWVTPSSKAEPWAFAPFLSDEDKTYRVIVKCMVPPMHHKEFAKTWLDVEQKLKGKHGNKEMGLFKIFGDTTVLLTYFEWENRKAFEESCTLKEFKPLMDYIKEKDITVYLSGMTPVEEISRHAAAGAPSDASAFDIGSFTALDAHMMDPEALEATLSAASEEHKPILLSKICVRPSKQEDFMSTFLDTKERMLGENEKGVNDVCLDKTHNDNVCYLGYEEWESKDKLHEYFKSDTHKNWMKFVHENNVASKVCMAVAITDMSPFDY